MKRSPEQSVGGVSASDRPIALYTPGSDTRREPVTYDPSSLWIAIVILIILFALGFGFVLLP